MAVDIRLSGLPPALIGVPSQERPLTSGNDVAYPEDTIAQQHALVADASGADMSNALGQDVHIAHRPTLNRLDSEQTAIGLAEGKTQDGNVPGDNDPGVCATPEAAVGMTYPPTLQSDIALAEPSLESPGLRRLRMASSFLILFLAGWKSVGFPLYVWWMYHAGVGQSSPWSSLLSHTFA